MSRPAFSDSSGSPDGLPTRASTATKARDDQIQPILAGFEVVSELGRGAESIVLRVRRRGTPRSTPDYAMKLLESESILTEEAMVAFRREAALLAAVDHPGLTAIHEVGSVEGRPFLVMDLLEGRSLASLLADGPLTTDQAITIALDVVDPLAAVHRAGLVHRDLKPGNLMVLPTGAARLIDFGLVGDGHGRRGDPVNTVVGTLAYSAPEQTGMIKRPVDRRSDLYSLGVVLFECLAGSMPFVADDVGEMLRMHAFTPAPALVTLVPDVPAGLARVVATLLAKDPDDRYQSCEALAADLRILAAEPSNPAAGSGAAFAPRRSLSQTVRHERLYGRKAQIEQLQACWEGTLMGSGRACLVRGAAGTGKSRLAAELAAQVASLDIPVLHAKVSEDDPVPFAPLRAALAAYLKDVQAQPLPERAIAQQRLRSAAAAGSAEKLLAGLTPALGELLDAPPDAAHVDTGQDQFVLAVARFLIDLARDSGGLLFLLDDVQWLDPGTASLLGQLSGRLDDVPLLLLATARDDEPSRAATEQVAQSLGPDLEPQLTLPPLDEADVMALVRDRLPGVSAGQEIARLLCARGNGNPFVIQEYLKAIVDAGLLRPSWGNWLLDEGGLSALELPQDAFGLVLARVDNLGPEVRDLLVTAAALGNGFRAEVVAAAHGIERNVVLNALAEAAGRGLLGEGIDGGFSFLHDRAREALLNGLDDASGRRLHQTIADALETMPVPQDAARSVHLYAIAHHHMRGEPKASPERAFAACHTAGVLALSSFAPTDSVEFLQHAAALGGDADADFLFTLADALKQDGRYAEARSRLEQALTRQDDPLSRARIFLLLSEVHRASWLGDEATLAVRQGLEELGIPLSRNRLLLALSTLGLLLRGIVRGKSGPRTGRSTGLDAERLTVAAALHEAATYIAVLMMQPEQIVVHTVRGMHFANRLGSGAQFVRSRAAYAFLCGQIGFPGTAERIFDGLATDPASAGPVVRALTAHYRGAAMYLGYHDNGRAWIEGFNREGQWLELGPHSDACSVFLAENFALGRLHDAARWLTLGTRRLALRGDELTSFSFGEPWVHALAGRAAEAARSLQQVEDRFEGIEARGLAMTRCATRLAVLAEQDETGEPFEQAVRDIESLGLSPAFVIRTNRVLYFQIALGRLAQLRRAGDGDRPARMAAAVAAVAVLRKARRSDLLRSQERIARADLLVLQGEPRRALKVFDGAESVHDPDAPLIAYEVARVRARALRALDATGESNRQARLAISIAIEHGWPHRSGWVSTEFGLSATPVLATGDQRTLAVSDRAGARASASLSSPLHGSTSMVSVGIERQRLAALEQVGAAASRVVDPSELARISLDETIRILGADRAFLFLIDAEGELVPSLGRNAAGQDVPELTGYSASLVDQVHTSLEPVVVAGTEEGAALGSQSVVLHGLRSIMAAPLQLKGQLLGVVYLDSQVAKGIFTADDVGILIALTNHIATSLETARAAQLEITVHAARRQRDLSEMMRRSLEEISAAHTPGDVLDRLLIWAPRVVNCHGALLVRAEDATGDPELLALIESRGPVSGAAADVPSALRERLAGVESWLAVPIVTSVSPLTTESPVVSDAVGTTGRVGVLLMTSGEGSPLAEQLEVAAAFVAQGSTAYDKATLFAKVQALAVEDELTGIANRRHFFEVADRDLAAAIRSSRRLSVLMIDIDHFKQVNDVHGHPTGDDVIREVAQRLAGQIRATDLIGRYGGEEFALVLNDTDTMSLLPERLRACICAVPVLTRNGPLQITISIGVTQLRRGDPDTAALLARADQALYVAKHNGRNQVATA